MTCPRCGGMCYEEKFYDESHDSFIGWRCLLCGDIKDRTIIVNRQLVGLAMPKKNKAKYAWKSK